MIKFIIGDTMKIVLFDKNLYTLHLPSKIDGSFSLTDISNENEILVNIEEKNNKWVMNATANYKILDNNQLLETVELLPNKFYILNSQNRQKLIYVEDSIDKSFKMYKVEDNIQFVIGKNSDNQLSYANDLVLGQHLALFYKNGIWSAQLAPKASIYINQTFVSGDKIGLKNGDVIYIYGLKIIVMGSLMMINNPNNSVILRAEFFKPYEVSQTPIVYDEPREIDYYSEDDYFFKTPRLRRFIDTYELKFANPPSQEKKEDMPLLLVLGPSLTMAIISFTMLLNVVSGIASGRTALASSWTRIISCVAMLMASLLWPNLIRRYNKKKTKEKNLERQAKYRTYLEKKKKEMISEGINQAEILKENLLSLDDCYNIILNRKRTLWERKISQRDFLTVRVGTGDIPIDMDIKFNEDEFTIEEDELKKEAEDMVNENKKLVKVPVGYSFYNKKATAIMGIADKLNTFVSNIILQLITFHSYDDLKIVILTKQKNEAIWEVYKNLPHCFSNNRQIRFFATDIEEMKTVSNYLEQEYISRVPQNADANTEVVENEDKDNSVTYSPYYLIFTDDFTKVRRLGISELILKNKDDFGFGFVIIENSLGKLPSECVNFITIGNQTSGILRNELDDYYHQDFNDEVNTLLDMHKCCEVLANIPIEFYEDVRYLPKNLGFLEMLKVGKVEQLNSLNRWRLNDPTKSLRAAIGINDLGNIVYLDLHEKYHGPHGLIAGMTGSGKSEFIITYILSMALNYSPNEVSFILIDYKGGGLAGAFENKMQNIRLPHLAGTITNLDKAELNRTLVSIDSELRRRQTLFNEARDELGESTIDIYKYQKFFRQKKLSRPIPHLFIICDEFAELKAQQPEFMDNLISTARIGRSLGVHLILATQKPSGVVNDQIWSNSKFRVCLKVQDRSDSNEMIKRPEAAEIKEAGRFYLQVGYDELFVLGQSGWCGTQYIPSDTINSEIDRSISYLDNVGSSIKDYDDLDNTKTKVSSLGDELSNVLKYITALARREHISSPRLWMDNIPAVVYTEALIEKYHYVPTVGKLEAIIGEYDDPSNQYQDILKLELGNNGNTIIYGTSSTNREMFVNTLIYSLCLTHSSKEVNFYIFDFGSESLRMFKDMPQVGDIVFASDDEKVGKLNKMIDEEISMRKQLFAEYNGEYDSYCRNSRESLPRKVYIFNNLDSYREMYPNCDEALIKYSREGLRYGIIIIITANSNSGLYGRLLRNFENVFVLDMPTREGYANILGKIGNVYPASYEGRGLFKGQLVYEYQTAQIYSKDQLSEYIKKKSLEIQMRNPMKAKPIPVLPDIVTLDMIKNSNMSLKNIPLGIYKDSLKIADYNFETDKGTIIAANDIEKLPFFLFNLIRTIKLLDNVNVVLFDSEGLMEKYKDYPDKYINTDFNTVMTSMLESFNTDFENNGCKLMIIILGIEKLKGNTEVKVFTDFMKAVKKINNIEIIISDNSYRYKKFMFETWYSEILVNANGIWIGNGVSDQSVIRITEVTKKYRTKTTDDYAWIFKNGNGEILKLINDVVIK